METDDPGCRRPTQYVSHIRFTDILRIDSQNLVFNGGIQTQPTEGVRPRVLMRVEWKIIAAVRRDAAAQQQTDSEQ